MRNILPVSDLRNYKTVLGQVTYGNPVYLTKNGRGDVAIVNIQELDELRALKGLFSELERRVYHDLRRSSKGSTEDRSKR